MSDTTTLWLGNQNAYHALDQAKALALANYGNADPEECDSELLDIQDGVGIIDIKGSLVAGEAGFMSYFGVTGYDDIRDALVEAVENPQVNAILLNIDSGGGDVSGCDECNQLLQRVGKIKPIVSYTGNMEASAALWLGSAAKYSFVSRTASTGSLGVMFIHKEYSQALSDAGIKVTIIRAGDQKALNNPYEPLSEKAKANLQAQANLLYDIFLGTVAKSRGVTSAVADTNFGQGRMFLGQQAVDVGLMDAVGTLEDAFAKAKALGDKAASNSTFGGNQATFVGQDGTKAVAKSDKVSIDTVSSANPAGYNATNLQGNDMAKPIPDEQLAAAAAMAGVTLPVAKTPAADATASTEPAKPEAAAAPVATTETKPSELVAHLQAQVERLSADLASKSTALEASEKSMVSMKSNLDALAVIARNSIKTMSTGLGLDASAAESIAVESLAAEHGRVVALFTTKFKVGGVAATNTVEENTKPAKVSVNPLFAFAVGMK